MKNVRMAGVAFFLLMMQLVCLSVKADNKADYLKLAQKVRQEVWDNTPVDFKKRAVPEKYKKESAVILSYYKELSTDYHRKATSELFISGRLTRQIDCKDMERMLIQINDKKALKDYSEFSFLTKSKKWQGGYHHTTNTILGIRVLKKDGTVQVVDFDDYVDVKEGKKGKELSQKIAVPGLEIGDCIDVFSLDQIDTQEQQLDPFVFFLRQSEPVLYSRIHCVLDQSLATVYRSMNGAPEFKQTTDKDKNAVLDLTMDQPVDAEPSVWYNSTVQSPYIMMFITPTKTKTVIVEKAMRKKGVRANPDVAPILQDDWKLMKTYVSKNGYSPSGLSGKYTRVFKALKNADLSAEEKADRIASFKYTCGGTSQESFNVVPNYLRKLGVELEMGITTPLGALPVDQLINYNSTTWFFRLKGTDLYYFPGVYPKVASEIPFIYQGRKAYMQDAEAPFEIPVSKASDNRSVVSVKASLDGTKMNISRRVVYSGEQKMYGQSVCSPEVSLYGPDHLEAYWRYLKYDDSDPYCVFSKKDASNIKAAFAEYKQKEQADQFKEEVAGYHESDPVKVSGYGVDCVGIRKDSADLVYHVDYEMEGLVKRAGSSMMLAVGKLIGEQMKLEGNDRIRKDRIWRKMAFADEWNIEVALPKGYQASAESLKKLNTTVSNDCGEFAVKASAGAGKIIVHVSKSFLHREEPVANWDKVLKLVDACSAFNEKQVVITKK